MAPWNPPPNPIPATIEPTKNTVIESTEMAAIVIATPIISALMPTIISVRARVACSTSTETAPLAASAKIANPASRNDVDPDSTRTSVGWALSWVGGDACAVGPGGRGPKDRDRPG